MALFRTTNIDCYDCYFTFMIIYKKIKPQFQVNRVTIWKSKNILLVANPDFYKSPVITLIFILIITLIFKKIKLKIYPTRYKLPQWRNMQKSDYQKVFSQEFIPDWRRNNSYISTNKRHNSDQGINKTNNPSVELQYIDSNHRCKKRKNKNKKRLKT